MQSSAEGTRSDDISSEGAWRVTNAYREAMLAKKVPVGDALDLPHGKDLIKEALRRLIRETDEISAKSKLTMMYLSLAEYQNSEIRNDNSLRYKTMVEESEKLLTDLRRLERSH